MTKKKKSPTSVKQQAVNAIRYLASGQAQKLPVYECFINPNWQQIGIATVIVSRKHVNGNATLGMYLLDTFCLGLKDTAFFVNQSPDEYQSLLNTVFNQAGLERETCDYNMAHNLVYGAIAYAEDMGFVPHPEWRFSQRVLEEDNEAIPLMEIEFGRDGMPTYVPGPYDYHTKVVQTLMFNLGEGNFDVILRNGDTYQNRLAQGLPFNIEEVKPINSYLEELEDLAAQPETIEQAPDSNEAEEKQD